MTKAYTKIGDLGYTSGFSGDKIPKDSVVMIAEGKLDSLQAALDLAIVEEKDVKNKEFLENVQKKLWQFGGQIISAPKKHVVDPVNSQSLKELEEFIDSFGEPPKEFVRFRTKEAMILNECRVRCRDLEVSLVGLLREKKIDGEVYVYINRLSSLFFMMAFKKR